MNEFIIGIDPGLNTTGVCILQCNNNNYNIILLEEVKTNSKDPIGLRLLKIYEKIDNILKNYPQVTLMGLEESFVNINNKSSLKLGMASGVILMLSAKYNLQLKYMSATHIKKKISGNGQASKEYVKLFVDAIVNVEDVSHHLYDAIAIAIVSS